LTDKKAEVEKIALALLDREVLHQQDVEDLIGKRPFGEKKIFSDTPVEVITEVTEVAKPDNNNTEDN
jgi:cell division protease FtsH